MDAEGEPNRDGGAVFAGFGEEVAVFDVLVNREGGGGTVPGVAGRVFTGTARAGRKLTELISHAVTRAGDLRILSTNRTTSLWTGRIESMSDRRHSWLKRLALSQYNHSSLSDQVFA